MSQSGRHVLVIAASEVVREMALLLVELDGHLGHGASTVAEGRDALARCEFDVVVAAFDGDTAAEVVALSLELQRGLARPVVVWVGEQSSEVVRSTGAVFREVRCLPGLLDARRFREALGRAGHRSQHEGVQVAV